MTATLKRILRKEIAYLEDWLAYASDEDLTMFNTLAEAQAQINGMKAAAENNNDIFPEDLNDPVVMILCWNYVVKQKKASKCETVEETETLWYAVLRNAEDDWGTGSRNIYEAMEMARKQITDYPETLIAVIDDHTENPVCVSTITVIAQ